MTQPHNFTVEEGTRLDVFITSKLPQYSRSKIQRLIEAGHATVNGNVTAASKHVLLVGQTVGFTEPEPDPEFPPAETGTLSIVYEDDALMVIDKPAGMVVHPNTFNDTGTLVQLLLTLRPEIKGALYDPESTVSRLRPGIVHRLDKDTSGLMVVAKTRPVMLALSEQFHKRTVSKEYETLLYGEMKEPRTVEAPIHRKSGTTNTMVASHEGGQGRSATTHFTPVEVWAPYPKWPTELATKVRVKIETGRTHQIRVHAKFIGHPVLGDHLYANRPSEKLSERMGLTHQQLKAVHLAFTHPVTGKPCSFSL
ncbi:MAG TPA: RluA family pseudouridine synthase [Verrucomicrobiae bacterium]|nr:RluA family pseudouridine synthase [Verrucomicrobiae bacterium]